MKITNRCGLPDAFVRAVTNDGYNNHGTLSVTTLIRPAWQVKLKREHADEIEEDAADRLWVLFGQANHAVLERTKVEGDHSEVRLFATVEGSRISGQFDRLTKDGVLVDYKFVSVYSAKDMLKNGCKKEYEQQLNMLAELIRKDPGLPEPKALRLMLACRDWRPSEARRDVDYPPKVCTIAVDMWPQEKAEEFIRDRVSAHTSERPPVCTRDERWHRPGKVAVMMKGQKRAVRLFDSTEEAEKFADEYSKQVRNKVFLEEREPAYPRCENYCSVSRFCSHWQDYLKSKEPT